ncbi:MAG: hypothetical protein JST00_10915 [Deltaproteobacteria bacterium]|nr:hypothetical protein [Deltaproteobacteria bacterium]
MACGSRATRETIDSSPPNDASAATSAPADDEVIAALRPFEAQLHREIDLLHPPSAETGLGADPWKIVRLEGAEPRYAGILRGRSELVLLDAQLKTLARTPTPRSPTGLAAGPKGDVYVTGDLSPVVMRYTVDRDALTLREQRRVPAIFGARDVAVTADGTAWVLDEREGRLHPLPAAKGAKPAPTGPLCHGASQLSATPHHLLVGCATEHEVLALDVDASGAITNAGSPRRIHHDGPVWGFDAQEVDGAVVVAIGGVENKPLDRREGFFGWIDSFVYLYRFDATGAVKLAEVNVAESGVVTPKALAITHTAAGSTTVFVGAYGSATSATVTLGAAAPKVTIHPTVPGLRSVVVHGTSMVMADPLLDAWVSYETSGAPPRIVAAEETPPPTHPQTRIGEALFFTSLMAPENTSDGAHSRFTCETCHFEGYADGRIHHTGREDIHAVTKPLVGLLGNRPYFTRALDPDLSTIAHAEFRVAGAGNGRSPFFGVDAKTTPWLAHLAPSSALDRPLEGDELRRSLMRFLATFSHRPNPAVIGRTAFTAEERRGAGVFRDRCEGCHAARVATDDPHSTVRFEAWEATILAEDNPIVWARTGYEKTGVVPYVHPDGARTSSLRRLFKKWPYFTNGSAKSIEDVLSRARFDGARFFHDGAPPSAARLDAEDLRALRAFLVLL